MFILKNWHLNEYSYGCNASGNTFGNYKFYEGQFIHTSKIEKIYLAEKDVYILKTHSGSLYQVRESDIDPEYFEQTRRLLEKFEVTDSQSDSDELKKAEEVLLNKKSIVDNAASYALEHIGINELYLVVTGMDVLKAVFKNSGGIYEIKPRLHVGMFQDSVLITDFEYGTVDFRFFPNNISMEPYHWSDNLEKIHIRNIGKRDFMFLATDKNIVCKAGEITEIAKEEYSGEGLISPDAVNGKSLLSDMTEHFNAAPGCGGFKS